MAKRKASAIGYRCQEALLTTMTSNVLYRIKDHECKVHKNKTACKQRKKYADQQDRASYNALKYCVENPR